jgi:hypothetical protein
MRRIFPAVALDLDTGAATSVGTLGDDPEYGDPGAVPVDLPTEEATMRSIADHVVNRANDSLKIS